MKCGCCGKDIGEIAFDKSYSMPDDIWSLSEQERAQTGLDLCRLDDRYFIRGVAFIPIIDSEKSYGWGIWVEVPQDRFFEYVKSYNEDNSSKPRFSGIVKNAIPTYESTIGLTVEVQLGNETQRPTFFFKEANHLLAKEHSKGISIEKVHSFSSI